MENSDWNPEAAEGQSGHGWCWLPCFMISLWAVGCWPFGAGTAGEKVSIFGKSRGLRYHRLRSVCLVRDSNASGLERPTILRHYAQDPIPTLPNLLSGSPVQNDAAL